jgi:gamma-glutamylcyclotransferase (GGCT)/AIG2-like uncharacterized protein YtfP
MIKNQHAGPMIGISIVIILLIIAGVYGSAHKNIQNEEIPMASTSESHATGTETYANDQYGFSFQYPEGMHINTLAVSGPVGEEDQFSIKELGDLRFVGVSPSKATSTEALLYLLQSSQGSNFVNLEKNFYNLGQAIYHSGGSACGGNYETIIHNGYTFTFIDFTGCSYGPQISQILQTFKFTK